MTSETVRNRLLAFIAVIVAIAAMKIGYPVLMPVVLAFFVIGSAWPIRKAIGNRWSAPVAYLLTIVVLLVGFAAFCAVIYWALSQVITTFLASQDDFRALYDGYVHWSQAHSLPLPGGDGGYERLVSMGRSLLTQVYNVLSYMGLVAVIVIMGFPQVPRSASEFRSRLETSQARTITAATTDIAQSFRSYLTMTVLTSLVTGLASAGWAYALGLKLAFVWGILNFLLNFIPIVGNILGILPPTLYAFIQYGGWTMPLVVFSGFVVLQLVISNFVYPMLQARGTSLPPVTIIVSLLFWGWLWGFAGALLAVPLTAVVVIVCRRFAATRTIALVLGGAGGLDEADEERDARKDEE